MDWHWYLNQILFRLTEVAPWLLGGLVGLGVFSYSPLGREVLQRLRAQRREAEVNEATLQELAEIRHLLGEVAERLDSTERRLGQTLSDRPLLAPTQAGGAHGEERAITPH